MTLYKTRYENKTPNILSSSEVKEYQEPLQVLSSKTIYCDNCYIKVT